MVQDISPAELNARLTAADPPTVLDVRDPWELDIARLPGTLDIPMIEVSARLADLPRNREVVVMCRSGGRSAKVAEYLDREGYRVQNLAGGILAWARDVDPTLATY
ncbi:MAG: rhodanese-like domain-containing protein [Steroidobacteraceae bacterium]